jgi:purine-nucleoside phosphorylase
MMEARVQNARFNDFGLDEWLGAGTCGAVERQVKQREIIFSTKIKR